MKHLRLTSLILALLLIFSLTACAEGKNARNKEKERSTTESAANVDATTAEHKEANKANDKEEQAAAPELEGESKLGQCFRTPERTKYAPEEGIPKEADAITKEDRDNGYVVDYLMGLTYYKPEAWRELEANSVMVDTFGNELFEGEPIYAGKAFYYMTPALAMDFEDLAAVDSTTTDTKDWEENLKAKRAPLFTLILYRTDQMQDDLTSLMENNDFPMREVIKTHGELTLVMGMGQFDEHYCGEMFMPDYESLYDGVKTIYESLSTFPPESYAETLKNRVTFDFKTRDLNDKKASDKDLSKKAKNIVLLWNNNASVPIKAFEELNRLKNDGQLDAIGTTAILLNKSTETITEEERAQLVKRFGDSQVPILLNDPSMYDGLTQYISRYPTYLLVDKKGRILDTHAGFLDAEALSDFISD